MESLRPLVRAWTWIAFGSAVWMLGYYLPTYKLVFMLPGLGVLRCPARMVLAMDMALATLAGVAVHAMAHGSPGVVQRLGQTIRRHVTVLLPVAMVLVLLTVAFAGWFSVAYYGGQMLFFQGGAGPMALQSVLPTNPAVWVQFALAAATVLVVRWWLGAPARRAAMLVALLLADLFFITRFVDVPGRGAEAVDPDVSPAARWLAANAPAGQTYRVWGIGQTYNDRPAELLRPKTAGALGVSTINTYGPFQSPAHAQLLGFRIFGTNRDWASLIRRNFLLTGYGVRYVLTDRQDVREVLESVQVPSGPPPPDGPNLLRDDWQLQTAGLRDGVLRLRTPNLWRLSIAKQPLTLKAGQIYRVALDARGPDGGAANFLRADIFQEGWQLTWEQSEEFALAAEAEQIGQDWRHFEWTFRVPGKLAGEVLFRVFTMSERPIEVRNVWLRESHWDLPVLPAGGDSAQAPGRRLYELRTELPSVSPGGAAVAIYENLPVAGRAAWRLRPVQALAMRFATPQEIERIKWSRGPIGPTSRPADLPAVGLMVPANPRRMLLAVTLPAGGLYLLVTAGVLVLGWRRQTGLAI